VIGALVAIGAASHVLTLAAFAGRGSTDTDLETAAKACLSIPAYLKATLIFQKVDFRPLVQALQKYDFERAIERSIDGRECDFLINRNSGQIFRTDADGFSRILKAERVPLAFPSDALRIASDFVSLVPFSPVTIIAKASMIPGIERNPARTEVEAQIANPEVHRSSHGYIVRMFTWSAFLGTITAWSITVGDDRSLSASGEILQTQVGNATGFGFYPPPLTSWRIS
jgi:hypothetical protein